MPDGKDGRGPDPRYRSQKEASDELGNILRGAIPFAPEPKPKHEDEWR